MFWTTQQEGLQGKQNQVDQLCCRFQQLKTPHQPSPLQKMGNDPLKRKESETNR